MRRVLLFRRVQAAAQDIEKPRNAGYPARNRSGGYPVTKIFSKILHITPLYFSYIKAIMD
jgi:hypothetical protein